MTDSTPPPASVPPETCPNCHQPIAAMGEHWRRVGPAGRYGRERSGFYVCEKATPPEQTYNDAGKKAVEAVFAPSPPVSATPPAQPLTTEQIEALDKFKTGIGLARPVCPECGQPGNHAVATKCDGEGKRVFYNCPAPPAQPESETPETDKFMTLIDDSEIDLGMVAAYLGDMEIQRNRYRDRLCIDPGGGDEIDALQSACEQLEARVIAAERERDEAREEVANERAELEQLFHSVNMGLPDQGLTCKQLVETFCERCGESWKAKLTTAEADRDLYSGQLLESRGQLAEARADKERLDWLEKHFEQVHENIAAPGFKYWIQDALKWKPKPTLRAALDAARQPGDTI